MKSILIIFFLFCITQLTAQVSTGINFEGKDTVINRLNRKLLEEESKKDLVLGDSLIIKTTINNQGRIKYSDVNVVQFAFSNYKAWASIQLSKLQFPLEDSGKTFTWVMEFGRNKKQGYTAFEAKSLPKLEKAKKNSTTSVYARAVFNYYLKKKAFTEFYQDENLHLNKLEGYASLTYMYNEEGKVDYVKIHEHTINSRFYYFIISKLGELKINQHSNEEPSRLRVNQRFVHYAKGVSIQQRWRNGLTYYKKQDYNNAYFHWKTIMYNDTVVPDSTQLFMIGNACVNSFDFFEEDKYYWYQQTGQPKYKNPNDYFQKSIVTKPSEQYVQPTTEDCVDGTPKEKFVCFQKTIMTHISNNFDYPPMERQLGIQGKVVIGFTITKNGKIDNVEVEQGVDTKLDIEAIRLVCLFPKFIPAEKGGEKIDSHFSVPIIFRLQ